MRRTTATAIVCMIALAIGTGCPPTPGPNPGISAEERRSFEITIFTDDPDTGRRVLAGIEAMGYTHPGNEVLDTPNDEFNIKWGAATQAMIDELSGIVEPMIHQELFPRQLFGPADKDIFINLPVCALGGAYKPETCGRGPIVHGGGVDPMLNHEGIPQACGMARGSEVWGSLRVGSTVILGRHRPWEGDDNWATEMTQFVGRTARITELFGTDGAGCPVVHVDIDSGGWFWRVRDMRLSGGAPPPVSGGPIPRECGMTDATASYGAIRVGTTIVLGRHTPWHGDDNWNPRMDPFVGRTAQVTELAGTDSAGCPLVKVDTDGGEWFWRIRDTQISGGITPPPTSSGIGFPQHCGMTDANVIYGSAVIGAAVRLGRHRPVGGDDNWNPAMESFVGQTGRVTEHLGVDGAGCPVLHVDADGGQWAWRVRDLSFP